MKEITEQGNENINGTGMANSRHFSTENVKLSLQLPIMKTLARCSLPTFFLLILCIGAVLVSDRWLDSSVASIAGRNYPLKSIFSAITSHNFAPEIKQRNGIEIPLNCSLGNATRTCPVNYYPSTFSIENPADSWSTPPQQPTCPEYFRWIHEDLWPWRETGITRDMVEMARTTATFRLVVLNGKAYVEKYRNIYQSRDTFTLWGILQLLRRYPGQIPDLDLMFDCDDVPAIKKESNGGPINATAPPALFRYCADDTTFDIVFPDWSFWGWAETNIKPWEALSRDLKEGNERSKWAEREPFAFWKGNPTVARTRMDMLKCNVSEKRDWGARIYRQNWNQEIRQGFKQSNLASQCTHRFKIYIEGNAWSVSEKYILACDSVALFVKPRFYDFFTRSLMPLQHYWPVKEDDKCRSIKYAVDWGNTHQQEAEAIGKAGSSFIQEELRMNNVYDYMFHLLGQYGQLLKYKPSIPPNAVEVCSESMACPAQGTAKMFMMDSSVKGPSVVTPCVMPPPYDPTTLHSLLERKEYSLMQVETWENQYWDSQIKPNN